MSERACSALTSCLRSLRRGHRQRWKPGWAKMGQRTVLCRCSQLAGGTSCCVQGLGRAGAAIAIAQVQGSLGPCSCQAAHLRFAGSCRAGSCTGSYSSGTLGRGSLSTGTPASRLCKRVVGRVPPGLFFRELLGLGTPQGVGSQVHCDAAQGGQALSMGSCKRCCGSRPHGCDNVWEPALVGESATLRMVDITQPLASS